MTPNNCLSLDLYFKLEQEPAIMLDIWTAAQITDKALTAAKAWHGAFLLG
jgi:hypothetical protein